MGNKALLCPTCSGQMMLTEVRPGDKIAKCEYCNTIVDLPDTAEKQGFDLNNLNTTTNTTTSGKSTKMIMLFAILGVVAMAVIAVVAMTILQ